MSSSLQADVNKYCLAKGAWGGKIFGSSHMRGWPDTIWLYKGTFIALEVKVGADKLSGLQASILRKIRRQKGIAEEVRSTIIVEQIFKCLDAGEEWIPVTPLPTSPA